MYAVFQTGGKQYQVAQGDMVHVEKIDAQPGDRIVFDHVLLLKEDDKPAKIGQPYLDKISVETEVVDQSKGEKILVYEFKRRQGEHKQRGHRQHYTCVKVLNIGGSA